LRMPGSACVGSTQAKHQGMRHGKQTIKAGMASKTPKRATGQSRHQAQAGRDKPGRLGVVGRRAAPRRRVVPLRSIDRTTRIHAIHPSGGRRRRRPSGPKTALREQFSGSGAHCVRRTPLPEKAVFEPFCAVQARLTRSGGARGLYHFTRGARTRRAAPHPSSTRTPNAPVGPPHAPPKRARRIAHAAGRCLFARRRPLSRRPLRCPSRR
jgi:hypothetical protein